MRRELLQLANKYTTSDNVRGWYISEKLDGTRCFWDGGISRGLPTVDVPWASITDPKTGEPKKKVKPVATGLWSRYGNPIIAPDWFLNQLPCTLLDGELWAGRGKFQTCRSICGGDNPDPRFDQIKYVVYSSPSVQDMFASGNVKNANMVKEIDYDACIEFIKQYAEDFEGEFLFPPKGNFEQELEHLKRVFESSTMNCYLHEQVKVECGADVEAFLSKVLELGGEGVVLRDPKTGWRAKRHNGILKYKPFLDAEATVIGFTTGRETDKGSRLLGKIGSLIVDFNGKRLELAGLTDAERDFATCDMGHAAAKNPGRDAPAGFDGKLIKLGQVVTFKYRELSDEGVPKEARYFRGRDEE